MKIAVVIETCDRRTLGGENYVVDTLRNLRRAGAFEDPSLHSLTVVNGSAFDVGFSNAVGAELPVGGVLVEAGSSRLTRQQTAQRAIRAGASTDAGWVLKLEDDLDFTDDFLGNVARWVTRYSVELATVPMAVLGATLEKISNARLTGTTVFDSPESFPNVRGWMERGSIAPYAALGWYGAQACLWTRPWAEHLANYLGDDPSFDDGKGVYRERGHDLKLQQWARSTGAQAFAATVPSFVQHVGRRSSIENPFFEFPFAGRDWRYEVKDA